MESWEIETDQIRKRWPEAKRFTSVCPGAQSLHLSHALLQAPEDGMVLEFGVGPGRTLRHLAGMIDPLLVFGFDSFLGLPEPWEDIHPGNPTGLVPAGTFNRGGRPPEGISSNVRLYLGWFQDSLPVLLRETDKPVRFAHIDCDIYSSTRTVLEALGSAGRIVPGTVLAFDELWNYSAWQEHEWKAWNEVAVKFGWRWEVISYIARGYQAAIRILP